MALRNLVELRSALPQSARLSVVAAFAGLAMATVAVAALEAPPLEISDASLVYLVAVVAAGALGGTRPAIAAAMGAFLIYDILFIEPRFTLAVEDPKEWLELFLFLFVAATIGRLSALQGERAREATRRARESQALFAISRILATADDLRQAAPAVVERLARDAEMDRVWIALERPGGERVLADSDPEAPRPSGPSVWSLTRTPGEEPAQWIRIHLGLPAGAVSLSRASTSSPYRVRMEAGGSGLGHLWALRARAAGLPDREDTRLLALAADQIALALHREALTQEAMEAEVTRRSEALKSALLDSVSHDFRTPLASIRATAGSLVDPDLQLSKTAVRTAGDQIETEVGRLSRFVTNLIDASRIEAGAIHPERELFDLRDLIEPVLERFRPGLDGRRLQLQLDEGLPPVRIDPVLFEQVLTNLIENAIRYAAAPAEIRVAARRRADECVELVVEDGGPGVPSAAMPRLFDKFYRAGSGSSSARRGLGLGLSVVRGLTEAMGGEARADRSELGGLAVRLTLPAGPEVPAEDDNH